MFHCNAKPLMLGFVLGNTPNAKFCFEDTNMLLSQKPCRANANPKICVTPKANSRRKQVEYRSRWVPNMRGWRWPCRFHVVCFIFGRVGYPMQMRYPVEDGLQSHILYKMCIFPSIGYFLITKFPKHIVPGGSLFFVSNQAWTFIIIINLLLNSVGLFIFLFFFIIKPHSLSTMFFHVSSLIS